MVRSAKPFSTDWQHRQWTRSIYGGLTTTAVAAYLDLWEATEIFNLSDQPDRTVWRRTPDGEHSAKSAYARLHTGSIPFRGHSLIWKTWGASASEDISVARVQEASLDE
jgi:hypothetical protein